MTTESTPTQLGSGDLKLMTAEQIVAARKGGQLEDLRRGIDHGTAGNYEPPQQKTRLDLVSMGPDEILAAKRAGQLDSLLQGSDPSYS